MNPGTLLKFPFCCPGPCHEAVVLGDLKVLAIISNNQPCYQMFNTVEEWLGANGLNGHCMDDCHTGEDNEDE